MFEDEDAEKDLSSGFGDALDILDDGIVASSRALHDVA